MAASAVYTNHATAAASPASSSSSLAFETAMFLGAKSQSTTSRASGSNVRRTLQGGQGGAPCNLDNDMRNQEFRCTLEEYCDTIRVKAERTLLLGDTVECAGDLTGSYYFIVQGYVCIPPGTSSWVEGVPFKVCFNQSSHLDFFEFETRAQYWRYDFLEGFKFVMEEIFEVCKDNPIRVCSCNIELNGRECNSCQVCNDGRLSEDGQYYSYSVDCSNLANGLVRTCDAAGWGDFFQQIEGSLSFIMTDPQTAPPTPSSMGGKSPPTATNNKTLSSAALGGIIGASVAVVLAVLLAIGLVVLLRKKEETGAAAQVNGGQSSSDLRAPPRDSAHVPILPPLAQVVLVDPGTLPIKDPTADSAGPDVKHQLKTRPYVY